MSAAAQGTLFDLCGGHPALDLVNSLDNRFRADGPDEMLASYADLLRFLEESGLLSRPHVRALNKTIEPDAAARESWTKRSPGSRTSLCWKSISWMQPGTASCSGELERAAARGPESWLLQGELGLPGAGAATSTSRTCPSGCSPSRCQTSFCRPI
jgi:hypothetical protein